MPNPYVIATVKCANCGIVKKEANHWFVVWFDGDHKSFHCMPVGKRSFPDAWADHEAPICGQECAQKELEKWMRSQ